MQYRRADGITWDRAEDRAVVLDTSGTTMLTLNPVGTLLWGHLDRPRAADELVDHLAGLFPDVGRDRLDDDVARFLAELLDEGLLVAEGGDS